MCCVRQRGQYSCIGTADTGTEPVGAEAVEEREREGARGLQDVIEDVERARGRKEEVTTEPRGKMEVKVVEEALARVESVIV